MGGIRGLTSNEEALARFFLAAPEINSTVLEFNIMYDIDKSTSKRGYHHQLTNATNHSLTENIKNLSTTLDSFGLSFEDSNDYVMNIVTKAIIPKEVEKDILNQKSEG